MERLGETREFGMVLLELLRHAGWDVVVTKPFAGTDPATVSAAPIAPAYEQLDLEQLLQQDDEPSGEAVLVIVERNGIEFSATGSSIADVAYSLFKRAMAAQRPRIAA